jgi:predicted NBD/HSP70 family sugar kinase
MKYFLSFDIGGTAVKYGIINSGGEILESSQFPTEAEKGPDVWMLKLVDKAEEYKKKYTLSGIPVSSTAMIDSINGRVFFSLPQVPHYTGFEVRKFLEEKTGLPVEVENDVNSVAIAESISGAGKGYDSVLSIAVGTGIGGGFTEGGKLLRGHTFSAAEVGYIKVDGGTLESMGSTTALVKRVERMKNATPGSYNGLRVVREAEEGDRDCLSALETMTSSIADGLVSLSYILNPAVIVLGGGIMKNENLVDDIRRKYRESINPLIGNATDIVKAKYDNEAGILGAYYHFLQKHPEALN